MNKKQAIEELERREKECPESRRAFDRRGQYELAASEDGAASAYRDAMNIVKDIDDGAYLAEAIARMRY